MTQYLSLQILVNCTLRKKGRSDPQPGERPFVIDSLGNCCREFLMLIRALGPRKKFESAAVAEMLAGRVQDGGPGHVVTAIFRVRRTVVLFLARQGRNSGKWWPGALPGSLFVSFTVDHGPATAGSRGVPKHKRRSLELSGFAQRLTVWRLPKPKLKAHHVAKL